MGRKGVRGAGEATKGGGDGCGEGGRRKRWRRRKGGGRERGRRRRRGGVRKIGILSSVGFFPRGEEKGSSKVLFCQACTLFQHFSLFARREEGRRCLARVAHSRRDDDDARMTTRGRGVGLMMYTDVVRWRPGIAPSSIKVEKAQEKKQNWVHTLSLPLRKKKIFRREECGYERAKRVCVHVFSPESPLCGGARPEHPVTIPCSLTLSRRRVVPGALCVCVLCAGSA